MKQLVTVIALTACAVFVGSLSPLGAQNGPKNFVSPTYRAPAVQAAVPHELTGREAKRLAATAELPADHLKLAHYYNAEADKLAAQAEAYEEAAASLRNGPFVKNFVAPGTPARYEFLAEHLREEAESDRNLAVPHERGAFAPLR